MPMFVIGDHLPVPLDHLLFGKFEVVDVGRWSHTEIVALYRAARHRLPAVLQGCAWGSDEPGVRLTLADLAAIPDARTGITKIVSDVVSKAFGGRPRAHDLRRAEQVVRAADRDARFKHEQARMDSTRRVNGAWLKIQTQLAIDEGLAQLTETAQQIQQVVPELSHDLNDIIHDRVENVLPKLPDESMTAILADPPYGINAATWDEFGNATAYWKWFKPIYHHLYRLLRPGGFILVFQAQKYFPFFWRWFRDSLQDPAPGVLKVPVPTDLLPRLHIICCGRLREAVWKGSGIGVAYDPAIAFFKRGDRQRRPKEYRWNKDFIHSQELPDDLARVHECAKAPDLCRTIVRGFCREGGLVLVPFSGVGSIETECKRFGRPFLGIEQEAKYVEVAKLRLARVEPPKV